jgi:hypothetical protein
VTEIYRTTVHDMIINYDHHFFLHALKILSGQLFIIHTCFFSIKKRILPANLRIERVALSHDKTSLGNSIIGYASQRKKTVLKNNKAA